MSGPLTAGPLGWLDRPSRTRGIRFAGPGDEWEWWPYDRLAALTRRFAAALAGAGVEAGDRVLLVERTGPHFVGLFFGIQLAGATVCPVAPPATFGDRDRYAGHLDGLLARIRPALVVADAGSAVRVVERTRPAGVPLITTDALLTADDRMDPRPPAATALIQFTSGTSGTVRGTRIPPAALAANVDAIAAWLAMTPADTTVSWLPVHHDMGLIGCLLAPVRTGSDLWLMPPEEFVRRPLRYLERFGRHGAQLTAMPGFGLAHLIRRVPPQALAGMDFSRWRALIVGAERVAASTLERFEALCAPYGLDRRALLPAYGLAEATLAVTGLPLAEPWQAVELDGSPVVGCGRPLAGVGVAVVDAEGAAVPTGQVGEIVVTGSGLGRGYAHATDPATPTSFHGDLLRTGDVGLLRDGQLYVLGRRGDSRKIRGRTVYAEDLDAALVAALDVPAGRVACVLDGDAVVVVFERSRPQWLAGAVDVLRPYVEDARIELRSVPSGAVPRTSSGKPVRTRILAATAAHRRGPDPTAQRTAPDQGPAASPVVG